MLVPLLGFSFQEDALPTELTLRYFQKGEFVELQASLLDEDGEPVSVVNIDFIVEINDSSINLGSVETNQKGIAILQKELAFLRRLGHHFTFEASFDGNDAYEPIAANREIQDAILNVKAETVDSVNTVFIQLLSWDEENEETGVSDIEIYFFIPRMFSQLPIGESYTDGDGEDQFEFPTDLPGGPAGELVLISKVDEHKNYGTIETKADVTWGIPTNSAALPNRSLWSPDAPLWMLITFIILMSGVWFHYYLIIYKLIQINKKGSHDDPINYSE